MKTPPEASSWSERHLINCVLGDLTAQDPYLAEHLRQGIMAALDEPGLDQSPSLSPQKLFKAIRTLRDARPIPDVGLECLDATAVIPHFSPLWWRAEALRLLRLMSPYPTAVLVVVNLRQAVRRNRQRWSRSTQRDYHEAIALLRSLTLKSARPSAQVHLIILS